MNEKTATIQSGLFDDDVFVLGIPGLTYELEFLTREEEASIIEVIKTLPLRAAEYKEYLARRRVMSFGGSYDFDTNELLPTQALDTRLQLLRERVAKWDKVAPESLIHALVAEYNPGTSLGWHRDVPNFEHIFGVSLGGCATLRFRPYPYRPESLRHVASMEVRPRSLYCIRGDARWKWQHSVYETNELRWSITFRDFKRT